MGVAQLCQAKNQFQPSQEKKQFAKTNHIDGSQLKESWEKMLAQSNAMQFNDPILNLNRF